MNNWYIKESLGGGYFGGLFHTVISLENLLTAWHEFRRGKRQKPDVQAFEFTLEDNIFQLHNDLLGGTWKPDPYTAFYVRDPKLRHIHKASVRDRLLHQAVFRILYPIFDKTFIHDSYSCREGKGVHRGVLQLEEYVRKASTNYTRPLYALKCDVKKFFDSVSHQTLFDLIVRKISDLELLSLILSIIKSFETRSGYGLPLGNVTSQLFANIYLNELDQFVKHTLKVRYYLRYCDDFIILDNDREKLLTLLQPIQPFLKERLNLSLHPYKVSIRKASQGIDFLGYVVLPHYRVLRTKTKRRMFRKLKQLARAREQEIVTDESFYQSLNSCLGLLSHGHTTKLQKQVAEVLSKSRKMMRQGNDA